MSLAENIYQLPRIYLWDILLKYNLELSLPNTWSEKIENLDIFWWREITVQNNFPSLFAFMAICKHHPLVLITTFELLLEDLWKANLTKRQVLGGLNSL